MLVLYSCYGGTHTSVLCAALHLGILAAGSTPQRQAIIDLPGFDTYKTEQLGHITELGVDSSGHRVFIASLGPRRKTTQAALQVMMGEILASSESYILVDSLRCIHWTTRVGGFLSRRLGWVSIGRSLAIHGIRQRISCFKVIVSEVRSLLRASP